MRALGTNRGVLAVPRIHPRFVRQYIEEALFDIVEERGEALRIPPRGAHAAGKKGVAGKNVGAVGLPPVDCGY